MVLLFMSSKEKKGEKLGFKFHLLLLSQQIVSLGQLHQFNNSFLLLELQQLFSKLQVARDQKKFVTSDEFEQLQKKYWNWESSSLYCRTSYVLDVWQCYESS